jgi:hypothetical protein
MTSACDSTVNRTCRATSQVARAIHVAAALVTLVWLTFPVSVSAAIETVVIRNDKGGGVVDRVRIIRRYQVSGTHIEIRGNYCLSACTLYLNLPNTCVSPQTLFGFHGPSSRVYGISLDAAAFDYWSRIMADHYPEPLRSWFLTTGRHRTVGFHGFSGNDLIQLGIAQCARVKKG